MSEKPKQEPWPINHILSISARLRTQDNQCTAEPMFCVEVKRREYGYMPEYCDQTVWIDTLDDCTEIPEPENPTDGQVETGFKDVWYRVMAAFTMEGAQDYIRQNGHNHRGEKRIYVESFRRCEEMVAIRKYLMEGIEDPAEELASLHRQIDAWEESAKLRDNGECPSFRDVVANQQAQIESLEGQKDHLLAALKEAEMFVRVIGVNSPPAAVAAAIFRDAIARCEGGAR